MEPAHISACSAQECQDIEVGVEQQRNIVVALLQKTFDSHQCQQNNAPVGAQDVP